MVSKLIRGFGICLCVSLILGVTFDLFAKTPKYGGKVTIISAGDPSVIGYYPEMGPMDHGAAYPGIECMMNMSPEREHEPELAERVEFDYNKNTMTFYIRKGVKFHDGSDLTAEVAAWNYNLLLETKKIQHGEQIKKVSVEGSHKLVLYLTTIHNQMRAAYGWVPMLSQKAFETHGKEWCRKNFVGTGPFKFVEWKRGSHMKWAKFDDYWQEGKPYLDEVIYRYIPDSVTASSLMQAGAAQIWSTADPKDQNDLEKLGIIRQSGTVGISSIVYFNTKDQNNPLTNESVRKAIELAIDRKAITKAIGYGYVEPIYMMAPKTEWAHDPSYEPREFNPAKAKKLLKEAGYAKGLKFDLLAFAGVGGGTTVAEAMKAYLGDVGVKVHIDMSDPGRFYGSLFGFGWKDMILAMNGVGYNSLAVIHSWYGHKPNTNLASLVRPGEFLEMSKESMWYKDKKDMMAITRKMSRYLSDHALLLPLYFGPSAIMIQPNIHTDYLKNSGLVRWEMADMWID